MKKALLVLAAGVVLVAAGLVAYGLYRKHQGRNIRGSPTEEFKTTETKPKRIGKTAKIRWPMYRFDPARQGAPEGVLEALVPPFRPLWFFRAGSLVEFPPSIAYGKLYFANAKGTLFAADIKHVRTAWHFSARRCTAATPGIAAHTVFMTFLNHPPCNATRSGLDGEVVALNADTGKVRWRVKMGPTESSPLVANGLVYVGDWNGKVYALSAATGRTVWTYQTGDKVKDGVALSGNRVFVGSYDSHVYALNARTGKLIWRAGAQERLGSRGTFYSTPAVAYGRVYIGSTDGKVYSFGATSGKLRWSRSTGGYVYASPAIWQRLVLVGSYGGDFYALDAATGDVRWRFHANGPISGSATVLNGIVYFATLNRRTYALDARTGRQLWTFPDGKYSPLVADSHRVYLVGYFRVYGVRER
jgi:outer membrane protein assembly factor BamB